jgi:ribonucleoside-diphosphate reductase alpha chain
MVKNDEYEAISEERKKSQAKGETPPWYTTGGYAMFMQKYLYEASTIREQFERIARTAAKYSNRQGAERVFFQMLWDGILSPSTPVLSNMGTDRGFPISCAGSYVEDSVDGFYRAKHETAMLTKMGFGTSAYLGDVRKRGTPFKGNGKASGVVPLFKSFVADMQLVSQGSNRRGAFAGYLPIDHGDFDELCDYLVASPDDLNVGWNVSDAFIARLNAGDSDAVRRYQKALKAKAVTGKGYFWFVDKANRKLPKEYHTTNKASNLCSEILLPSDEENTYSCVLSSLNLVHWDEIRKNAGTKDCYIQWATEFLNCVVDEFLDKSWGVAGFKKIRRFTERYRALGLGVCGYHTLLMQKRIPWESLQATWLNMEIFDTIRNSAEVAKRGNTSLIAIAPTKSTALLMGGVSEGINPQPAFTFTQTTAAGNVDRIDPVLLDIVKERCEDVEAAIKEVNDKFGSVQHVSWLTEEEKEVFKTAFEIDQKWVLRHAAVRSKYIDQWQSVNLFFSADESEATISEVHKEAFQDERIIGLYYMHTLAGVKGSTGECEVCQ